jgi:adenylate cyclase class IV
MPGRLEHAGLSLSDRREAPRCNVRVHLDEVRHLEAFIELEAVAEQNSDLHGGYRNIPELRDALGITDAHVLPGGSSDLLSTSGGSSERATACS